ncbi:uncharacterized protein LOC133204568 [Saccostrea echinata]|uniref:uncharacterized protein LOC133204568 n=1 Tax=Saccostrea echinata TaxID=191078 RepID=UPI002A829E2C|nr:uncharacterized protein LOC133204568 [Saccostrea echinata]
MEEDSSDGSSTTTSSTSRSPLLSDSVSRMRKHLKRKLTSRSRSHESEDSYSSGVKCGRRCGNRVSEWDMFTLESHGIFYDEKATELFDLYKSVLKNMYMYSVLVDDTTFWTKLLQIKEFLIESTKRCMNSLDADEGFAKMEQLSSGEVLGETKKCVQAIAKIKEEIESASSLDTLSWHLFSLWHAGILEYVQYYSDLIKELFSERRIGVEGEFCQLLTFFSKIFLINAMRGDALQKVQMTLNGTETTSVPDLRYSLQGDATLEKGGASLMTVTVGKVKMWLFAHDGLTSTDFNIRDMKLTGQSVESLLGQHGEELLLETKKSVIGTTCLGMICVKTMIIFTRLDMDRTHLTRLVEGSKVEDLRSSIHYSKPYNFLVRKDREEILDTMFHLGLLCRVRSSLALQD